MLPRPWRTPCLFVGRRWSTFSSSVLFLNTWWLNKRSKAARDLQEAMDWEAKKNFVCFFLMGVIAVYFALQASKEPSYILFGLVALIFVICVLTTEVRLLRRNPLKGILNL
jgi:Flp pilus assembly protein TadB